MFTIGSAVIEAHGTSTYDGVITVEDGRLRVRGLSQASYLVLGGELHLPFDGTHVELAGGDLLVTDELSAEILISQDARIVTENYSGINAKLSGNFTGDGNLTLVQQTIFDDQRHRLVLSGASPEYAGDVTIDSLDIAVSHEHALGTGAVTILPSGRLTISSDSFPSPVELSNDIRLQGGDLQGIHNASRPQRLLGDLHVTGWSSIGQLDVAGDTYLEDGARLTTLGEDDTVFSGDIYVGGRSELEYGLTYVNPSFTGPQPTPTKVSGAIASNAEHSVLNLLDRGLSDSLFDASYHAAVGQTLEILHGGQPFELVVDGEGNKLFGQGAFANGTTVRDGAAVSPGDSSGAVRFAQDLRFDSGGVYAWEMLNPIGDAGDGWDLIEIDGVLSFDSSGNESWVLKLHDLGEGSFDESRQWLIATADEIVEFDSNATSIDASALWPRYSEHASNSFSLHIDRGDLVLTLDAAPGDYDLNATIDGADFLRWQRGQSLNSLSNEDLATWTNNFGNGSFGVSSAAAHVPEPSTTIILLAGLALSAVRCLAERKRVSKCDIEDH